MSNRIPSILKFLLFLGIGILLLWLIMRGIGPGEKSLMMDAFRRTEYFWVVLSVVFGMLSHLSRAIRWRMLIRPLGYNPRLSVTFCAVLVGYLANMAVPRLGEVTKCGLVSRYERVPADKMIGTMIVERSVDLIMLVLVTLLTLLTQYGLISGYFVEKVLNPMAEKFSFGIGLVVVIISILAAAVLLGWLSWRLLRNTGFYLKLAGLLANVKEGLFTIRKLGNFPLFVFHSVFIWAMYFAMVWICFYALPETSQLGLSAGLSILVFGSVGIIVSPGGIGAYQLIVTETLQRLYLIEYPIALAFSWIVWSAQTISLIIGGTISLMVLPLFKVKELVTKSRPDGPSIIRAGESAG